MLRPTLIALLLAATGLAVPGAGAAADDAPGPAAAPDKVRPVISGLKLTPRRVSLRALRSPAARFSLSEAAQVRVTLSRLVPGRKVPGRCVTTRPKKGSKKRPRCVRPVAMGRLSSTARAGAVVAKIRLPRSKRALPSGGYRVTIDATDAAGNRAKSVKALLTITSS